MKANESAAARSRVDTPCAGPLHRRLLVTVVTLVVAGCGGPQEPLRIGFMSDLSQRTSDAGHEGRNAVQLAVEQRNAAGGIHGRRVELRIADSGSDDTKALAALQSLREDKADAIVGAVTSATATAVLPGLDASRLLMVSAMASATSLAGRDDYLVRTDPTTRDSTQAYARELARRGQRRVAIAFDQRNAAYTGIWLAEFRAAFHAEGAEVVAAIGFGGAGPVSHATVAADMLVSRPDGVLFIASAFDSAHLAQKLRALSPTLPMAASGWAGTPTLVALGGQAVEGLLVIRSYDAEDESPRYRGFLQRYQDRFGTEPAFTAVSVYEAASVLLQALERARPGESPREALLRHGPYEGLQQPIGFDRHGDTRRTLRFSEVRDGRFQPVR